MKIVINTNVCYKKALTVLFRSLLKTGFRHFNDVVVVISGSKKDSRPSLEKISKITYLGSACRVTLIRMRLDNYDYTGYHALNLYSGHALVSSDYYMYVPDTVTFDRYFPEKRKQLLLQAATSWVKYKNPVFIAPGPHSNICVLGAGVIKKYGSNFSVKVSKRDAVRLEFDRPVKKGNRRVLGITRFGVRINSQKRFAACEKDLYGTGYPRIGFYYEDFGLYKWILWGKNGDFNGDVADN